MRILVTGSRTWRDATTIAHALDAATSEFDGTPTLIHGTARGADTIAAAHAARRGWRIEPHPADWSTCGPDCRPDHWRTRSDGALYCPTAGHRRNAAMVAAGADVCLAFIRNASPGATACARLADRAGIAVVRLRETS
jgi:hypothetical protein